MGIFDGYLLVSDMDGTLLNSKGKLCEENIKAIEYFVENGGKFTLATGRMLPSVQRYVDRLKVNLPVILYNGTKIYDFYNSEVVFEKHLEEERKHIIKKLRSLNPNIGIEIYSEEIVYIYQSCSQTARFSKLGYNVIYDVDESIWDKKWTKILIIGEEEELDKLEESFEEFYGSGTIIRSAKVYLEIVPNYISKGQAVKSLVNERTEIEKIISIGDNMNDLELLEVAHYGFCVKNGSERLIKSAKNIAPTNDEHAIEYVVKWIETLILGGK